MLYALCGSYPFPPIIIVLSVMCVMRVRHTIHVMRTISVLLTIVSYQNYDSIVGNSR